MFLSNCRHSYHNITDPSTSLIFLSIHVVSVYEVYCSTNVFCYNQLVNRHYCITMGTVLLHINAHRRGRRAPDTI